MSRKLYWIVGIFLTIAFTVFIFIMIQGRSTINQLKVENIISVDNTTFAWGFS